MKGWPHEDIDMALEACREYRETINRLVDRNLFLQREVEHFKKLLDKATSSPKEGGSSMGP
jgi:regulator of replication initiation timing